jgi:hypothetical protein
MLQPAAHDTARMVTSPLFHGVMDDRQVHRSEHTEGRCELALRMAASAEAAQHQRCQVQEGREQRCGEAGLLS